MRNLVLASVLAIGGQIGFAEACEPSPRGVRVAPPQGEIDAAASSQYDQAIYIAEVIVVRSPRPQWRWERKPPPPGLLRVVTKVKGSPPATLLLPLPDPCMLDFQKVGERLFVVSLYRGMQPSPLPSIVIDSLKQRKIGTWSNVR